MKKINFENAEIIKPAKVSIEGIDYEVTPAQLTVIEKYLSAETLNEMQDNIEESCVIVSPTEPTTNEKVWIQKGKNLFDKRYILKNSALSQENGGLVTSSVSDTSRFIKVEANKQYIFAFTYETLLNTSQRAICYYNSNQEFLSGALYTPSNKQAHITPTQDGYVRISYDKNCTNIQLEQGTGEATEYEAYIDKKIKIDGEEFINVEEINKTHYSTAEQVIGTWTKADGKKVPLYSKMIETQAPTTTADGTYSTTLTKIADNIDIGFIEWAFITDGAGQRQPLPYINNSGNMIKGFINGNKELYLACNIKSYTGNKVTASIKYTKTTD